MYAASDLRLPSSELLAATYSPLLATHLVLRIDGKETLAGACNKFKRTLRDLQDDQLISFELRRRQNRPPLAKPIRQLLDRLLPEDVS